mmetsp:Transcript_12723/g.26886  ORF Transcript_12723/g.26886 Transcript_12723/m.26886 type:complete len:85 (+) Transcript_12723:209-463(+)
MVNQKTIMRNDNRTIMHANGVNDEPASSLTRGHSDSVSFVMKGTAHTALSDSSIHFILYGQYLHPNSLSRHSSHLSNNPHSNGA